MEVPLWATLVVAGIPTLGSIAAAIIAGRSAHRARQAQLASETERELRQQLAAAKSEVYEPMLDMLRRMMDSVKSGAKVSDQKTAETLSKFTAWVSVYGSDEAVRDCHKLMQSMYSGPSNGRVVLYYYGRFLLAARRDLGPPNTTLGVNDILGLRINDLWSGMAGVMAMTESEFLKTVDWTPPWPPDYGAPPGSGSRGKT